jgi:hypothetical protein
MALGLVAVIFDIFEHAAAAGQAHPIAGMAGSLVFSACERHGCDSEVSDFRHCPLLSALLDWEASV